MIYGTDIALINNELQIAANGEACPVDDADTVIQDIMICLGTYKGSLFYDPEYGSYLMDFINDEDSEETRFGICDEVVRRVEEDPRVTPGTPTAYIAAWTVTSVTVSFSFELIGGDSTYNLVLALDKTTKEIRYERD